MVIEGGFRFCNTYPKTFGTKFNSITYLTATKKSYCNQSNCCSYYTKLVTGYRLVFLVYV